MKSKTKTESIQKNHETNTLKWSNKEQKEEKIKLQKCKAKIENKNSIKNKIKII